MDKIIPFLKARLAETSTKATIITLLSIVLGAKVSPENIEIIATIGIGVLSLIAGLWGQDKKSE